MSKPRLIYIGNQLAKHGFTPTSIETLGERLCEDFNVVRASTFKNMGFRMFHMWWTIFRHRRADYLIIDTYSTSAFFFAWTSARLAQWLKLRYIPILHGGALPERARKSPERIEKYLSKAFKVICPSPYLKLEMEKVIANEYQVIPNAIDLEDYHFKLRVSMPKAVKLLWVRSFHEIYNPELAIHILKGLHDKGYKAELCMVGPDKDGSLKKVQTLAESLGVLSHLKITGKMSKLEWIALSADYDIFINTTNVDNTPVSVIEALALGLPVISTNVGGLPHLLRDRENALLVDPNNDEAFLNAIESLRSEDLYKRLSHAGSKIAHQFSWSSIRDQWGELLI